MKLKLVPETGRQRRNRRRNRYPIGIILSPRRHATGRPSPRRRARV